MNYWTTANGELISPRTHLLHCDLNPAAIGAHTPATYGVRGDARLTATALHERILAHDDGPRAGYRGKATRDKLDAFDLSRSFSDRSTDDRIDPRTFAVALDGLLPAQRTLAVDGGHFTGFPTMFLSVPDPQGFCFAVNFGAVGLGLGTGMGAAIGRPDRLAIAAVGDGGAYMTLGDLETAVRHDIPILVVIFNDGAYGAELHHLDLLQLPSETAIFGDTSLAPAAAALGAKKISVQRVQDLDELEPWLENPTGLCVVEAHICRAVRAEWLEQAIRPQVLARMGQAG